MNPFPSPLRPAVLIRRYKRFLADVELPDGIETVHCPNPGAMTGMAEPGSAVLISESASRQRKLPLTWELVRVGRTWVCVNSQIANRVVGSWLRSGWLFPGAGAVESEVRVGSCRFDFRIGGRILVEVKTVTLRDGRFGAFPDSVTKRGTKHVESLAALKGGRRVLLFFVGRGDVSGVRLAEEIDPVYAAARSGVEILAVRAHFGPRGVRRGPQLDVSL